MSLALRPLLALSLCFASVSLLDPSVASAQSARPAHELRLELDVPIVLLGGAAASSFFFMSEAPGVACAPECDESRINALDRHFAGRYDRSWSLVGDVATVSTIAAPLLVVLLDEGLVNGLNDDLVIAETALVTSALQVAMSYAVARPRPRVYGTDAPLEDRTDANAARSFFSGHVANTVGTSVAALRTFQRLGKPGLGWLMLGAGLAGSGLVGVSRVASGSHFPSDVLVGAAVGAGVGLAIPAMHRSNARVVPVGGSDYGALLVSGSWQ